MERLRATSVLADDGNSALVNLASCLEALPAAARHVKRLELLEKLASTRLSAAEREASGRALVAWLAEGSMGAPTRRRVVGAVLELGFPWALHLDAEDLQVRPRGPARRFTAVALVSALLVAVLGVASQDVERQVAPTVQAVVTEDGWARRPLEEAVLREPPSPEFERAVGELMRARPARAVQPPETPRARTASCLHDVPESLDCVFDAARVHARRSREGYQAARSAPTLKARVLQEAAAAEDEALARALYRRYLSIAPTGDPNAPVIVAALRRDGDWVEWTSGEAAARELDGITLARECDQEHRVCLASVARAWEARASRTKHPDDVAAAERARAALDPPSRSAPPLANGVGPLRGLGHGPGALLVDGQLVARPSAGSR